MTPCLSPSQLEMAARDGEGSGNDRSLATERQHLEHCPTCRAAIAEIRANREFLEGIGGALRAAVNRSPEDDAGDSSSLTDAGTWLPEPVGFLHGYRKLDVIGQGGQAVVHRAVHEASGRLVAVKVLHFGSRRQRARLVREAQLTSSLRHPGIVTVHDCGDLAGGGFAIVMELVKGQPLTEWSMALRDDATASPRANQQRIGRLFVRLCDAVSYAHRNGVIHRDLKPANVLVAADDQPRILDFGVAHATHGDRAASITHTQEFTGTLAYSPPEALSGTSGALGTLGDVYAIGVMLHEAIVGYRPHHVDGPIESMVRAIIDTDTERPSTDTHGSLIDADLAVIMLTAIARDPARRYESPAALGRDLERWLGGEPIDARRESTWYVLRKTVWKYRILVAVSALMILVLAVFSAAMAVQAYSLRVRGGELATALGYSTVERGRALTIAGNIPLAERALWPEFLRAVPSDASLDEVAFGGSPDAVHAYWALWDVARASSCIATLNSYPDRIVALRFDVTGDRLQALNARGRLLEWARDSWSLARDTPLLDVSDNSVARAIFASDGCVVQFAHGTLLRIDPTTNAAVVVSDDPECNARVGDVSRDGSRLATVGIGAGLCVRDARTLERVTGVSAEEIAPSWPRFSFDGSRVAAARPDRALGLWDATTGELEQTLRPPDSLDYYYDSYFPSYTAFGEDGTVASLFGPHVVVWPPGVESGVDIGPHEVIPTRLEFLPGSHGRLLVATGQEPGGAEGLSIVWDLKSRTRAATFTHAGVGEVQTTDPRGRLVAVGDASGTVRVFDTAPNPHITLLHAEGWGGSVAALSDDGTRVALTTVPRGESGRDLLLVDVATRELISRTRREGTPTTTLLFSPHGDSLFEGDTSGQVVEWSLPTCELRRTFIVPRPEEDDSEERARKLALARANLNWNQLRLSRDGSLLARAEDPGVVDLWDLTTGMWIDCLETGIEGTPIIEFSPDGSILAVRTKDTCQLWSIGTRRVVSTFTTAGNAGTAPIRFSPDGSVIATAARGGIQFVDAKSGRIQAQNIVSGSVGLGLAFHPAGTLAISSGDGNSIQAWDSRTGSEVLTLRGHKAFIISLVASADGRFLLSSDWSGAVLLWDLGHFDATLRRDFQARAAADAAHGRH